MLFHHKGYALFTAILFTVNCYGQYDGINDKPNQNSKPNTNNNVVKKRIYNSDSVSFDDEYKSNPFDKFELYKGMEFMTTGGNNRYLFLSFDPQVGYWYNHRLLVGGGAHFGINGNQLSAGAFIFGRLTLNKIFIQTEYRAVKLTGIAENKTLLTPIFSVGYMLDEDMSSWVSIGLSTNGNYSQYMPYGPLVYRIGFRF